MFKKRSIKKATRQLVTIVEKNVALDMVVKARFISIFLNPFIQLILYLVIFRVMFNIDINYEFGYWNFSNYLLFLLLSFCVQFSTPILDKYRQLFFDEKYWKTLSAIMIAPLNQITLLLGVLASVLAIMAIPFVITYMIALIMFPIPLEFIFLNILVFFLIFIVFASIGLIIGAFSISREGLVYYSSIFLRILLIFSCIYYPVQFFPEIFQFFIKLNPLYYAFDLLRLTWYMGINYEIAFANISLIHILSILSLSIISPIVSIYLFKIIYKKYGIKGY
ncbi:MAG: ABC transporter permease [Candidatus Odinarchaeota archaeon]